VQKRKKHLNGVKYKLGPRSAKEARVESSRGGKTRFFTESKGSFVSLERVVGFNAAWGDASESFEKSWRRLRKLYKKRTQMEAEKE
jgi:hypothetical protein